MANQPDAIALGITTGFGQYYHALPDAVVEALRTAEAHREVDASANAPICEPNSDSDKSDHGAQLNEHQEELNPSDVSCGDSVPSTPVEFRLMSALTEEMKIQSPVISGFDAVGEANTNAAETDGQNNPSTENSIYDHQQSTPLTDESLTGVFDLSIGQPQATVDQNHPTSYQNAHDEQFSQEIVFGEQDFAFFDFDMAAVDNMGSSENMEVQGFKNASNALGQQATQQPMFLCSPHNGGSTYLFVEYFGQGCTEQGQTVLPVPSSKEIDEWNGYLDAVQQNIVTFDPNYWGDKDIRIQLYLWFYETKVEDENSDCGFMPDSSSTPMSPTFSPGTFADSMMGSDMTSLVTSTSTSPAPFAAASPAQFTDCMMDSNMASPITSTSTYPLTLRAQRPARRSTLNEPGSKRTDVDLDSLLDDIPTGLLGDVSQAKEARMASLREMYYRRMSQQGPCQEKMCHGCYHPGHDDPTDEKYCPVARLLTYINDVIIAPYTVGSNAMLSNIDMFFVDSALIGRGYEWTLETFQEGDAATFGITVAAVKALETVVERCDQIKKEGLILKETGLEGDDLGGDFAFGDAIVGVEDNLPDGVDLVANGDAPESLMLHGIREASNPPPKPKRNRSSSAAKKQDICDIFELQHLGTRVNSVCGQCYYRGHVINSTKTCPTSILQECLHRSDSGRSWAHDMVKYCTAADLLRTVTGHLKDANDPRYERLENLIKDFDEIRESPSSKPLKRKSSPAHSSSETKRRRSSNTPALPTPSAPAIDLAKALDVIPFGPQVYDFLASVAHDAPLASLVMKQNYIQKVPVTGGRADTQCPNCHHFGHDQRAKVCPLLFLRDALASGKVAAAATAITSLSNVARWYAGLPSAFSGYKKDTSVILTLFSEAREKLGLAKIKSPEPQKTGANASREQRWTLLVDIARMDGELLNELTEYMLPDDVPAGVGMDHRLMSPNLFRKILPFIIKT
ncbi:hypothetical protein K440DRAFT_641997 [Wilcoxina mikolae CBS 423.85]|nr:hypothetical protein K440DRAFT_641997 [Wilcoxina mikolae CBS 423.85]